MDDILECGHEMCAMVPRRTRNLASLERRDEVRDLIEGE
jgi:hypothetical protein